MALAWVLLGLLCISAAPALARELKQARSLQQQVDVAIGNYRVVSVDVFERERCYLDEFAITEVCFGNGQYDHCGVDRSRRNYWNYDAPSWYYGYNGRSDYRQRLCHNRNNDRYEFPNGDYVFISNQNSWYNSYLGGPYYDGYRGFNGNNVRVTLTLAVAPNFQEAVVVDNRAGRGGVSEQARTVLSQRGVTINNENNPITQVFAPPTRQVPNNAQGATASAPGASASAPGTSTSSQSPTPSPSPSRGQSSSPTPSPSSSASGSPSPTPSPSSSGSGQREASSSPTPSPSASSRNQGQSSQGGQQNGQNQNGQNQNGQNQNGQNQNGQNQNGQRQQQGGSQQNGQSGENGSNQGNRQSGSSSSTASSGTSAGNGGQQSRGGGGSQQTSGGGGSQSRVSGASAGGNGGGASGNGSQSSGK